MNNHSLHLKNLLTICILMGCLLGACQPIESISPTLLPEPIPAQVDIATNTLPPAATFTATTEPIAPTETPLPTPLPTPTLNIEPPRNVILIIVDALRPDHLSSYGYSRPTSPNLDRWMADEGVRFAHAVASAPWTCPSNASLLTGRLPSEIGAHIETLNDTIPNRENTLAEYMRDAGFLTAGFVNNSCTQSRYGFSQGFNYYDDSVVNQEGIHTYQKLRADEVNQRVMDWLSENWLLNGEQKPKLFLMIYYMETHVWFDPPAPYNSLFDSDYAGAITPGIFDTGEKAMNGELILSPEDIEHMIALYDGEIASWDENFGQLMTYLEQNHILEETLVTVTSDHGEFLGEHGRWNHMGGLFEEVLRVPLFFRYPGATSAGKAPQAPVQSMDLMPTILDWVGIPIPANLSALSLRGQAMGGAENIERIIFSEVDGVDDPKHWAYWAAPRSDMIAVRQGSWKLIQLNGDEASDELYYINDRPTYEMENLIDVENPITAWLREKIREKYGP